MVAAGDVAVEEDAVQRRICGEVDVALLLELAPHRLLHGLTVVDAASGQVPAADIAVPDQEHPILVVQHHGTHAEGHAADHEEIGVEESPQQRLAFPSDPVQTFSHQASSTPRFRLRLRVPFDLAITAEQ
jgi:hypothetical protein